MLRSNAFVRVRYADTDKMQVVYNAKYFEYFEVGRTEMMREIGLPYSEVERMGYILPVLECSAKFIKPARFEDLLRIETSMLEIPKPFLIMNYKIFLEKDNTLLVEGSTKHIFAKMPDFKPVRPFKEFLDIVNKYY